MPKAKEIITDNLAIRYTDEGNGPVLIFVHGWLDSGMTFTALIDELKSNFRCIALDLPNFGASQQSDEVIDLNSYAHFLSSFLGKLGIKEYSLVGHSMGGQIEIYAIGEKILQPKKLVLLASAGVRSDQHFLKQVLRYGVKPLRKLVPRSVKNKLYKKVGSDYSTDLRPVHKKIINKLLITDIQTYAPKITCPVLLIYGEVDSHTPASMGQRLAALIPDSKLIVTPGQDHWIHQRDSQQVAESMRKFLL